MVEEAVGIESIFGGHGDFHVGRRPHQPVGERVIDQRRRLVSNKSNNQGLSGVFIGLGVLLMVLGALFLVVQAVGFDPGRFAWPFYVIVPGLAVFGAGLAAGNPAGERITPLGAALTTVGVILLYQNTADHFESWAYAWALVFPTSIGLGRMIYGSLKGRTEMVLNGGRLSLIGAALFLVGALFFELVVGISSFGIGFGRFGWPLGLVIVGIVLLVGGILYRRR
jgi:hypothetical protein